MKLCIHFQATKRGVSYVDVGIYSHSKTFVENLCSVTSCVLCGLGLGIGTGKFTIPTIPNALFTTRILPPSCAVPDMPLG